MSLLKLSAIWFDVTKTCDQVMYIQTVGVHGFAYNDARLMQRLEVKAKDEPVKGKGQLWIV